MLSPSLLFTGSSSRRPPRTKAKMKRGDPRYDESEGQYIVPPSNHRQQARDAAFMQREQERAEEEKHAKRAKYDNIQSLASMSKQEYCEPRKSNFYELPRTSDDPCYWRKEQVVFMKDIYSVLKRSSVCPQKCLSVEKMRKSPYFSDALWISEKLGLFNLMEIREDYNITLVQQFYAIVVFGTDQARTMTWMTSNHRCSATFYDFAEASSRLFRGYLLMLEFACTQQLLG